MDGKASGVVTTVATCGDVNWPLPARDPSRDVTASRVQRSQELLYKFHIFIFIFFPAARRDFFKKNP